ncbi:MAG: hypothetical protein AAF899_09925 [Pseudomonadota bacterium]
MTDRDGPITAVGVKRGEKTCSVIGIQTRIEHFVRVREGIAVPAGADLEATDIDVPSTAAKIRSQGFGGFDPIVQPATVTFCIQRPRPDHAPPAAFGKADGNEQGQRHIVTR